MSNENRPRQLEELEEETARAARIPQRDREREWESEYFNGVHHRYPSRSIRFSIPYFGSSIAIPCSPPNTRGMFASQDPYFYSTKET